MDKNWMENLKKEYEAQKKRLKTGSMISRWMILAGLLCMAVGLLNRGNTPVMLLFFALTIGSAVIGVLVGENRKKEFSSYAAQTVTRKVMEEYFRVNEFILQGETPLDEIRSAELFWNYNRIIGSRVIRGELDGTSFQCSNVTLDETTGTANKNTRVFSGQYLLLNLDEKIQGTIRILDKENPVKTLVQGCRPVKISSVQEFDDLFEVSATDLQAAREYLTEDRRKALLELKRLIRERGGEEQAQLNLMIKGDKVTAALGSGVFLFHRQRELDNLEDLIQVHSLDAEYVQKAVRLLKG